MQTVVLNHSVARKQGTIKAAVVLNKHYTKSIARVASVFVRSMYANVMASADILSRCRSPNSVQSVPSMFLENFGELF